MSRSIRPIFEDPIKLIVILCLLLAARQVRLRWSSAAPLSPIWNRKAPSFTSWRLNAPTSTMVKGRKVPRVMVVISDEEACGFLFSYDKLIGTKAKSKTDLENEAAGNVPASRSRAGCFM